MAYNKRTRRKRRGGEGLVSDAEHVGAKFSPELE